MKDISPLGYWCCPFPEFLVQNCSLQKDGLIVIKHGSGSVVASREATERSPDQLLRPLRTALTELVLAGLSSSKILSMVIRELRVVGRGNK